LYNTTLILLACRNKHRASSTFQKGHRQWALFPIANTPNLKIKPYTNKECRDRNLTTTTNIYNYFQLVLGKKCDILLDSGNSWRHPNPVMVWYHPKMVKDFLQQANKTVKCLLIKLVFYKRFSSVVFFFFFC